MSKDTEGLTISQLAEINAEHVMTISALEQQLAESQIKLAQMAAEINAVDAIHNEAVFITDDHYEQCPPEVQKMIRTLAVLQVPATDAFMAEVRNEAGARAVELFAQTLGSPYAVRDEKCYEDGFTRAIEIVRGAQAPRFADQLRKGVQS